MKLKDFQQATVERVLAAFKHHDRYLVADEVGLGKTIIARGVIDALYQQKRAQGQPFHVVYICSNQTLAAQNLAKLSPVGKTSHPPYERLTMMAPSIPRTGDFFISSLTPHTSFKMSSYFGSYEERQILYKLLNEFSLYQNLDELKYLLRGTGGLERWLDKLSQLPAMNFDADLKDAFISLLSKQKFKDTFLGEALEDALTSEWPQKDKQQLILALRKSLSEAVLETRFDADLFVVDEFQRFKELIEVPDSSEGPTEVQLTAHKVFNSGRKVLLLSATPYKAFSTNLENLDHDDHFSAFQEVLQFVYAGHDPSPLPQIGDFSQNFFRQLDQLNWQQLAQADESTQKQMLAVIFETKSQLQALYLRGIARTERLIAESSSLIEPVAEQPLSASVSEIRQYVEMDRLTQSQLSPRLQRTRHHAVDFIKSTPFPLSFAQNYVYYEALAEALNDQQEQLARQLLSESAIDTYSLSLEGAHGKLDHLLQEAFGQQLERWLWIPPACPYYRPDQAFDVEPGLSKILIFSNWAMVPRALSTLLSYEQERRMVLAWNQHVKADQGEDEALAYFPKHTKERRKPAPRLVFRATEDHTSLTLSCLLYPSRYLVKCFTPQPDVLPDLDTLMASLTAQMRHDSPISAADQQAPLWAMPFYLDRGNGASSSYRTWLDLSTEALDQEEMSDEEPDSKDSSAEAGSKQHTPDKKGQKHFQQALSEQLLRLLESGQPFSGSDSHYQLAAEMALGSPAVCAYRMLQTLEPNAPELELQRYATRIAAAFFTLYNKPESIMVIETTIAEPLPYWRKCLRYGIQTQLQAMLDEYAHFMQENASLSSLEALTKHICVVLKFRTSSIKVNLRSSDDPSNLQDRPLRCHFAVEFGNQPRQDEKTHQRMGSVRDVFNSPFRPFVLTSTSIGQEGLDFHGYCRRLYHWNLPHNPIDLEQREGRINRYKGHAIRLNLARMFKDKLDPNSRDPLWQQLFQLAVAYKETHEPESCELVPYWHLNMPSESFKILRYVPLYRFSKEQQKYQRMLKSLAIYRLTLGQANQEALMASLLSRTKGVEYARLKQITQNIMLNLSPILAQNRDAFQASQQVPD